MIRNSGRRILWKAWFFWIMGAVFYLYEMILRASPGVMANDLRQDFGITPQTLGFLSSMYYWAYTPLQIPCGLILDKVGPRKLIAGSCILCALSCGLFGWTESLSVAYIARFLMGAGSACAFISALALSSGWFPASYFSLMAGLTSLLGSCGGVFAGEPLAFFTEWLGWRATMLHLSWVGLILSVLMWFGIRDPQKKPQDSRLVSHFWNRLKRIAHNPQIWLIGIVGGLLYLPISAFAELWAIPFLQETYHLDQKSASFATMILYIMNGAGGPIIAMLSTRWKSYIHILKIVAIAESILFIAMALAPFLPYASIIVVAGMIGFVLGGQILIFSVVKGLCHSDDLGSAYAFTNALVMGCGLIFQPLLGKVLQASWSLLRGGYVGTDPYYTGSMYAMAIVVLPLAYMVSWILLRWAEEHGKQNEV
jgi:predicted MFS family arabinose efflux permease